MPKSTKTKKHQSFTLIELITVLAIISILITILIAIIKPIEILKKVRDNKRITDLKNIEKTIDLLYTTYPNFNELTYASTNIVYLSLQDNSPTCTSYLSQLPPLPSGWSYRCSATPTNIDGTGWIPIPFNNFDILNLTNLPIDPINKPPYYYSFVAGGSYKITAKPETNYQPAINDGGIEPLLYEAGSNKKLSTFQSGLVLYLPFDEGNGTTIRDVILNATGTIYNPYGDEWVSGVSNYAYRQNNVATSTYFSVSGNEGQWASLFTKKEFSVAYFFKVDSYYTLYILAPVVLLKHGWRGYFAYNSQNLLIRHTSSLGGGTWQNIFCGNKTINLNQWYFFVYTFSKKDAKCYLNATLYSSPSFSQEVDTVVPNSTIVRVVSNTYWRGTIDEVRIYNVVLSAEEIKALYEATK
mgnify:CR=1 FL=1